MTLSSSCYKAVTYNPHTIGVYLLWWYVHHQNSPYTTPLIHTCTIPLKHMDNNSKAWVKYWWCTYHLPRINSKPIFDIIRISVISYTGYSFKNCITCLNLRWNSRFVSKVFRYLILSFIGPHVLNIIWMLEPWITLFNYARSIKDYHFIFCIFDQSLLNCCNQTCTWHN